MEDILSDEGGQSAKKQDEWMEVAWDTALLWRCTLGFTLLWKITAAVCAVGSCVFIVSAQDCVSQVSGSAAATDILDPPTEQTRSDSALCDVCCEHPLLSFYGCSGTRLLSNLILWVETKTSHLNQMTMAVNRLN